MIRLIKNHLPFFSVVITAFNRKELLKRAVKSLINQSFEDWEAIIVDDGSDDKTYEYAIELCQKNNKFRYVFQKNKGQAAAKNLGIISSTGLFVTFLDSDDEYEEEHLDIRNQLINSYNDITLLYGGCKVIGDNFVPDLNDPSKKINIEDSIVGGTFFLNRKKINELGGFPLVKYGEDNLLYNKLISNKLTVAKADFKTYIYHRGHEQSLTKDINGKKEV